MPIREFPQPITSKGRNDDFGGVARQERNDAKHQGFGEIVIRVRVDQKPARAEGIKHHRADHHGDGIHPELVFEFPNQQRFNKHARDIANQITAGRAEENLGPSSEIGENRHPRQAKEQIKQNDGDGDFPRENRANKIKSQSRQGYCDGLNGDGNRGQDAHQSEENRDQAHLLDGSLTEAFSFGFFFFEFLSGFLFHAGNFKPKQCAGRCVGGDWPKIAQAISTLCLTVPKK